MPEEKEVNFDDKEVKNYLSARLGIPERYLADLILPDLGTRFEIGNLLFEVRYRRGNPFRITAEPIGVVEPSPVLDEKGKVLHPPT